jgi:hypothetical protein
MNRFKWFGVKPSLFLRSQSVEFLPPEKEGGIRRVFASPHVLGGVMTLGLLTSLAWAVWLGYKFALLASWLMDSLKDLVNWLFN